MTGLLKLGVLGFGIALGAVVGSRLSGEATALALGVVLGVLAGLPMGALVLLLQRRGERETRPTAPDRAYPPVVVVNPGLAPAARPEVPFLPPASEYSSHRPFKIIGEEEPWE